eukprot:gene6374-biopygen6333
MVRSSMESLWMSVITLPVRCIRSSTDRMHTFSCPSSDTQMGSGVPQYLFRDTAQSRAFSNQFVNRPTLTEFGTQLLVLLQVRRRSLKLVTLTNHDDTAL